MKIINKIFQIISWLVIAVILLTAGTLVLSTFNTPLKIRVFSVLSGSMEPAISTGSLVLVKSQDEYHEGDVVTVRAERNSREHVTHRVYQVETLEDKNLKVYQLKGDANDYPDSEPIIETRVIGKVIGHLPLLGRIVGFAQTQMGFVVMIVIPATLIIYSEAMNIKKEVVKMIKAKKKTQEVDKKKADDQD